MSAAQRPVVALHWTEDGALDVLSMGDVRVIWIDERVPRARVYEQSPRDDRALIERLLAGATIGHRHDAKLSDNQLQAIVAKLRPGLHVVDRGRAE